MALVSLAQDNDDGPTPNNPIEDTYGWGTSISLTADQCEALGLTSPPTAGTRVMVHALAVVQSVTQSVDGDADDPDVRMCLQLTDMEIVSAPGPAPATALYGGGNG